MSSRICANSGSRPLVIAHRGYSARALENSMEAIRLALELPVDMIEIDLRRSLDGELFVLHDAKTGRVARQNLAIERTDSATLRNVMLKNGEPLPTLDQVLDLVSGAVALNLEIKSDGAGLLTERLLRERGYAGEVLISSFAEGEVAAVRQSSFAGETAVIFDKFRVSDVAEYRAKGYGAVSLSRKTVTEKLLAACRQSGIAAYIWTVDDKAEMERLISWGCDGIFTNDPGRLRSVLSIC